MFKIVLSLTKFKFVLLAIIVFLNVDHTQHVSIGLGLPFTLWSLL